MEIKMKNRKTTDFIDVRGNKIYVGDIFRWVYPETGVFWFWCLPAKKIIEILDMTDNNGFIESISEVKYDDKTGDFMLELIEDRKFKIELSERVQFGEVIGNIEDNPELLINKNEK